MSGDWTQYFEHWTYTENGKTFKYYEYKDKRVITLPANLPMPPTKSFFHMFDRCWKLQDITALSKWDVSNVKSMNQMFCYCQQLQDVYALSNWDMSSVKDTNAMFYGCNQLRDITALSNWDMSSVKDTNAMFHDCYLLSTTLQRDASSYVSYISRNIRHYKETEKQIAALQEDNKALQKENTELKSRLAFLEEKMDFILSRFSEMPQWNL